MDLAELPSQRFRRHPWEEARFRFLYDVLRGAGLADAAARILDAGAGDGWFAAQLGQRMPAGTEIVCWDASYTADIVAPAPGISFTSARPQERFDVVLLLDVLEHVEDDASFLARLVAENLAPGGAVLVTVPAWPALFGRHDVSLRHFRRYRPADCRRFLARAGLEVVAGGGLFHAPLVPRAGTTLLERLFRADATTPRPLVWRHGALAGRIAARALSVDTGLSRWLSRAGVDVPGLSWWARCRKPS